MMYYNSIQIARRQAKAVAKDFKYIRVMPDVFERIKKADTEDKIADILTTCRKRDK